MYYHLLSKVDAPLEVGVEFPQVHCINQKVSAHRFRYKQLPDSLPDLQFELSEGAILTDLLSEAAVSAHGLLMSGRMKEVFASARLPLHSFHPAIVITPDGERHSYTYLQVLPIEPGAIDFRASRFFIRKGLKNIGDIEIASHTEYLAKKEELGSLLLIVPYHVVLNTGLHLELDVLALPLPYSRLLVSAALAQALMSSGLTGHQLSAATDVEVGVS